MLSFSTKIRVSTLLRSKPCLSECSSLMFKCFNILSSAASHNWIKLLFSFQFALSIRGTGAVNKIFTESSFFWRKWFQRCILTMIYIHEGCIVCAIWKIILSDFLRSKREDKNICHLFLSQWRCELYTLYIPKTIAPPPPRGCRPMTFEKVRIVGLLHIQ